MTVLAPYLTQQFFTNSGAFNAGGFLYTYSAGSSTPIATYTDSTGGTPNSNPVILNSRGECSLWINPNTGYKFALQDSSGNPIWTRDNVTSQQLLTLYGGVDTGATNAYVVNFAANFTSLTNGIVIYFIPANSNTGGSTLNVNSLGAQAIVQQSGNSLVAGQIVGGQVTGVMYYNGSWLLLTQTVPYYAFFNMVPTGCTTAPNIACNYAISGSLVSLTIPYTILTSNAVTFTLTGLPAAIQPVSFKSVPLSIMQDNTAYTTDAQALFGNTNGNTIYLAKTYNLNGWTASGTKGIGWTTGLVNYGISFGYNLL